MQQLPTYISLVFILTTIATLLLVYKASNKNNTFLGILSAWLLVQGFLGSRLFYTVTDVMPPRILLLVLPPLLTIGILFYRPFGLRFINRLNTRWLTGLHTVRIPVEIVLFWLFVQGYVPQLMTFEGVNFDIFSGLTAPLIVWYGYMYLRLPRPVLLLWNVICVGLLLNIVVHAVLSAPFPFQQMGFEQPNIAILYFPFVWLPGFIVPVVLFAHLVCIRQIILKKPLGMYAV